MDISIRRASNRELLQKRIYDNRKRVTVVIFLLVSVVAFALFVYLHQHLQLVQLVNEKEELNRQLSGFEKIYEHYKQEEVTLSSLQRIEFVAREQLGMVFPSPSDRWILKRKKNESSGN